MVSGIAVWLLDDVRQRRRGAAAAGRPAGESLAVACFGCWRLGATTAAASRARHPLASRPPTSSVPALPLPVGMIPRLRSPKSEILGGCQALRQLMSIRQRFSMRQSRPPIAVRTLAGLAAASESRLGSRWPRLSLQQAVLRISVQPSDRSQRDCRRRVHSPCS